MLDFEEITEIKDENSFANVINILGAKNLIRCFRSALYNQDICCITDNEILQKNLKNYFQLIFDIYTPKITVSTSKKYLEYTKDKKIKKKKKNIFIFNPDQDKILQQPFNKNFRPDKFKLEISILKNTNLKNIENQQVLKQLNEHFDKVFMIGTDIINKISTQKIVNKYQMKDFIESSRGNISIGLKEIEHILKHRFDFKPIFIPENGLAEWRSNTYGKW